MWFIFIDAFNSARFSELKLDNSIINQSIKPGSPSERDLLLVLLNKRRLWVHLLSPQQALAVHVPSSKMTYASVHFISIEGVISVETHVYTAAARRKDNETQDKIQSERHFQKHNRILFKTKRSLFLSMSHFLSLSLSLSLPLSRCLCLSFSPSLSLSLTLSVSSSICFCLSFSHMMQLINSRVWWVGKMHRFLLKADQ
jgi:hypothetical protein